MTWLRTRYPGVTVRHRQGCAAPDARCRCTPSYRVRYRDADGKAKWSPVMRDLDTARTWQTDNRKAKTADPEHAPVVTFRALADEWFAGIESGAIGQRKTREPFAARTIYRYRMALRNYILPTYGDRDAASLTPLDWQLWVDEMHRTHGLSRNSIDINLNPVRNIYRWACAPTRQRLPHNALVGVELPPRDEKPRTRVASKDEAAGIVGCITDDMAHTAFALAFYSGLRISEIMRLDWHDVDLAGRKIHVRGRDGRSKTRAGVRTVPLIAPLSPILKAAWLRDGKPEAGGIVRRPVDKLRKSAREDIAAAGFDPITPHNCRHTFVSYCIGANLNALAITKVIGHASVQTTFDRYGHLFPGHEAEAADRLDAYFAEAEAVTA